MKRLCMLALPCLLCTAWGQPATGPAGATSATLVTLHHKDAPAGEVFADLRKQLGFPPAAMPAEAETWPHVTVDVDKQPYWTALAAIDDQLHKTVLLRADGTLDATAPGNRPFPGVRLVSGSFLIALRSLEFGVTSPGPAQKFAGRAEMDLRPEPGLALLQITTTAKLTIGVDDLGHSLISPDAYAAGRQSPYSQGPGAFPAPIVLWLTQPAEPGQKIARLEGTLSAWVGANPQTITIDGVMTAKMSTHPWAGGTLRINPIRRTGDRAYQVDIMAEDSTAGGSGRRDLQTLFYGATAQLLDDTGAPLFSQVASTDGNSRFSVRGTQVDPVTKAETHEPARLVITLPAELKEITIPFAFKDLPMP